jgi:membrane protease YdiL (CAAX protease family)
MHATERPLPTPVSGRPAVLVLAVYLAIVFLGAALLAPWLWKLVQAGLPDSSLARQPFHRYVNRCLLVLALGGLWPLYRLGFFEGLRKNGFAWERGSGRRLFGGVLAGFGSLALVAVIATLFHARTWNLEVTPARLAAHVSKALGAAVAVSILEEVLFRGMVFGTLRRSSRFWIAAIVSASIYALVHFFQRPEPPGAIGPWTGFSILGRMSAGFVDWQALIPGFINLTVAGWLLAWCREKSGALWMSIGLHAGWIFWLKSYAFFTKPQPLADVWIWGSSKLIDGWLALAILLLTAAVLGLGWKQNPPGRPSTDVR